MKKYILLAVLPVLFQSALYCAENALQIDTSAPVDLESYFKNKLNEAIMPELKAAQRAMNSTTKLEFYFMLPALVVYAGKGNNNKTVAISHLKSLEKALEEYRSIQYPNALARYLGSNPPIVTEQIDPALEKLDEVLDFLDVDRSIRPYAAIFNPITLFATAVTAAAFMYWILPKSNGGNEVIFEEEAGKVLGEEINKVDSAVMKAFNGISSKDELMRYAKGENNIRAALKRNLELSEADRLSDDQVIQLLVKLGHKKDRFVKDISSYVSGVSADNRDLVALIQDSEGLMQYAGDNKDLARAVLTQHAKLSQSDIKKLIALIDAKEGTSEKISQPADIPYKELKRIQPVRPAQPAVPGRVVRTIKPVPPAPAPENSTDLAKKGRSIALDVYTKWVDMNSVAKR